MSHGYSAGTQAALLLCAGEGTRLGFPIPKAYVPLRGLPLFAHAAYALLEIIDESNLFIVVSPEHKRFHEHILSLFPSATLIEGGAERHLSVINGLKHIADAALVIDGVFIHDACRPFVSVDCMRQLTSAMVNGADACAPAFPCKDTIKSVDSDDVVTATLPRHTLRAVQTPQLLSAHAVQTILQDLNSCSSAAITDDLSFAELLNLNVAVIPGDAALHKLTDAGDYKELIAIHDSIAPRLPPLSVQSTGVDAHAYGSEGSAGAIMLGGIDIPFHRCIIGHSDGDVVLHAITDALLGCCAARDIGYHFSDTHPDWKDADSSRFLLYALGVLRAHGYTPDFIDITILCQTPYLSQYIARMQLVIATLIFDTPNAVSSISIKATTTDRLGFLGRSEGLACISTVSASYKR